MAPPKTFVEVEKFAIKDVFDSKYKSSLPAIMQAAAEKAVKSSGKLAVGAPPKGSKGYTLDGSLVSLGPDKAGKTLQGECTMSISVAKSIKAVPNGKAAIAIDDAGKIDPGDVQAVAVGAVESAMASATKYMEKNPP